MSDDRDEIQRAADLRNSVDRLDELIEKVENMTDEEWANMVRRGQS